MYICHSLSVQCLGHFIICLVNRILDSKNYRDTSNNCSRHINELRLRLRSGALIYHVVFLFSLVIPAVFFMVVTLG
jgi:hypothetical protein